MVVKLAISENMTVKVRRSPPIAAIWSFLRSSGSSSRGKYRPKDSRPVLICSSELDRYFNSDTTLGTFSTSCRRNCSIAPIWSTILRNGRTKMSRAARIESAERINSITPSTISKIWLFLSIVLRNTLAGMIVPITQSSRSSGARVI